MSPVVKRVPRWFAEPSVRGVLMRMVGGWLLIGIPVIASRIWWSVPAAIAVSVLTLSAYLTFALRDRRCPRRKRRDAGDRGDATRL
jgi:hypothetical protein